MRLRRRLRDEVTHATRDLGDIQAGLERPELPNAFLLRGDKFVELQDLDGVVALLPLPESENVSHVRRSRAVEKPLVLAQNRLPQRVHRRARPPSARLAAAKQLVLQRLGRRAVASAVEMDTVVRELATVGRSRPIHRRAQRFMQRKKCRRPLRRNLAHNRRRALEFGVVAGGIGPRCAERLMAHRPDEHDPRTGRNLRNHVQQSLIFRPEFLPAGLTLE